MQRHALVVSLALVLVGCGGGSTAPTPVNSGSAGFATFSGVVEVEGHRTQETPGLTNYVETIHGDIAFEGQNDSVTRSSGSLTYGMSGWNLNNTLPCGICYHSVSGTVDASLEPVVSKVEVVSSALLARLTPEEKTQFLSANLVYCLSALSTFKFKITSYKIDCCGSVINIPKGEYDETLTPLFIPLPEDTIPYKFSATIDGWSGDIFFTTKSFARTLK
jgi:hypothetical protein